MARRKAVVDIAGEMARKIARRFSPDRVILFGSHARGDATPESDIDLLVIMDVTREARSEARRAIRAELRSFRVPLDIVVASPEEYAWRSQVPGTIERPAMLEGRVLYVRS